MTTLKTGQPELYTSQGKDCLLATTPAATSGIYRAFPSVGTCTSFLHLAPVLLSFCWHLYSFPSVGTCTTFLQLALVLSISSNAKVKASWCHISFSYVSLPRDRLLNWSQDYRFVLGVLLTFKSPWSLYISRDSTMQCPRWVRGVDYGRDTRSQ